MRYSLLLDLVFILLLIRRNQAHVIDTYFNMVEHGQKITGKLEAELVVLSTQECAVRLI